MIYKRIVGVDDAEGPPVPIPNTEVKLSGAENTWLATARENREMPTHKSVHPAGWAFFYFIGNCSKTIGQRRFDNINLSFRIACRGTRLFMPE